MSSIKRIIPAALLTLTAGLNTAYTQEANKENAIQIIRDNTPVKELNETIKILKDDNYSAQKRITKYRRNHLKLPLPIFGDSNLISHENIGELYDILSDGTPVFMSHVNVRTASASYETSAHTDSTGQSDFRETNGGVTVWDAAILSHDWSSDINETAQAVLRENLLFSHHSYGVNMMWTPPFKWGEYGQYAAQTDRLHHAMPFYLQVWSAGNDRGDISNYFPEHNGHDILTFQKTAKNNLVVAVADYSGTDAVSLSASSNWGPTDDGRIKPDVSTAGSEIIPVFSDFYDDEFDETSSIADSLLRLQRYNCQKFSRYLRASTVRGLALHTADETGGAAGPDYRFGWGLFNMKKAESTLRNAGQSTAVEERTIEDGETYTFKIVRTDTSEPLKLSICWTDPAGHVNESGENDRSPALVNDLDLRLIDEEKTYYPWKLNPADPSAPATKGDNSVDNIEVISVDDSVEGKILTVQISHKNRLKTDFQDYSLIVSGGKRVQGLCKLPLWQEHTAYLQGEEIEFNGDAYRAIQWNMNDVPSKDISWGAWEYIRDCNSDTTNAPLIVMNSSNTSGQLHGLQPITFDISATSSTELSSVALKVKSRGDVQYLRPEKADAYVITYTPEKYGLHTFEFIAVDILNRKTSHVQNIFVYEAASDPEISFMSLNDQDSIYLNLPTDIKINASATIGRERDVYISSPNYPEFGRIRLDAENAPEFNFELNLPADFQKNELQLTVDIAENNGAISKSESITLNTAVTEKPSVQLISFSDTLVQNLSPISIRVKANDPDGSIDTVFFMYQTISGAWKNEVMSKSNDIYITDFTPPSQSDVTRAFIYAVDNKGAQSDKLPLSVRTSSGKQNHPSLSVINKPVMNQHYYWQKFYPVKLNYTVRNDTSEGPEYIVRSEIILNDLKIMDISYNKQSAQKIDTTFTPDKLGENILKIRTLDERGAWTEESVIFRITGLPEIEIISPADEIQQSSSENLDILINTNSDFLPVDSVKYTVIESPGPNQKIKTLYGDSDNNFNVRYKPRNKEYTVEIYASAYSEKMLDSDKVTFLITDK